MATQTSKLKKKLQPAPEPPKEDLKPKTGQDRLRLTLMAVTALIMMIGYDKMNGFQMGLYSAILGSIVTLYYSRHMSNPNPKAVQTLKYISLFFLILVMVLIILSLYFEW